MQFSAKKVKIFKDFFTKLFQICTKGKDFDFLAQHDKNTSFKHQKSQLYCTVKFCHQFPLIALEMLSTFPKKKNKTSQFQSKLTPHKPRYSSSFSLKFTSVNIFNSLAPHSRIKVDFQTQKSSNNNNKNHLMNSNS